MLKQTVVVSAEWAAVQDTARWLTERERAQERTFSSRLRRTDWRAGRLAVKRLVQEQWDIDPLTCEVGTDGIAPLLAGMNLPTINISLSHGASRGAASWEDNNGGTVGVDIQHVRRVHPGLARRILSPGEWAQGAEADDAHLLLFWALKEAAIKACRRPYRRALREIDVTLLADGTASIVMPSVVHSLPAEYVWTDGAWLARAVLPRMSPQSLIMGD